MSVPYSSLYIAKYLVSISKTGSYIVSFIHVTLYMYSEFESDSGLL